jgi:hypothetical protein
MARIRTIKPELPQSESMGKVSRDARLLFILTWTLADDSGRLRGSSRMLASLLFPYDDDAPRLIDGWVNELVDEDCIQVYSVEGSTYIQIAKWLNHQKIDKPSPSKIPEFDEASRILAKCRGGIKDQGPKDQGPKEGTKERTEIITVEQKPLDVIVEIFGYWQKTMSSPKSVLDTNRKGLISTALKNYSPADLCKAIRGCSKSPHNMGQNKQKTKYNGLGLILRNAEKIDRFIELDTGQAISATETLDQRNARIIAEVMADVDDENTIEME